MTPGGRPGPAVLGLLFEGADPSAALLVGGRIVAFAEEERFVRRKHAPGVFPLEAARYCLEAGGLAAAGLDAVAVGWDAAKFPDRMRAFYAGMRRDHGPLAPHAIAWQEKNVGRYTRERLEARLREQLLPGVPVGSGPAVRFVGHHLAHAASAFLPSGFDAAAVVTADGHGEDDCTHLWVGEGGRLRHLAAWHLPFSLGWVYTKFTQHFGFHAHDGEGKLMGLAAYGKAVPELMAKVARVYRPTGGDDVYTVEPAFFLGEQAGGGPYTQAWLDLFGPPRSLESTEPFSQERMDLAFAVQDALERIGLALAERALAITGMKRLCVAGGTFMNCKLNGVLAARVGYGNLFAQPASGDNGISLGAALAVHAEMDGGPGEAPLARFDLGPAYGPERIEAALRAKGLAFRRSTEVEAETARFLAASKVVGWFQGRMEGGARALGHRSILANPTDPAMSGIVNRKVKFREPWRPFCPSVVEEEGEAYFDYRGRLPFMIVACRARDGIKAKMPSVVHVDGTVRVQTVSRAVDPRYHRLLLECKALTGYPVLLNTSFNVKGEPIVCTPEDAVACFLATAIDVLVLDDYIVTKVQP